LLARGQALRRRFVEHCSWEDAMPTLKDPNRVPDASTIRRWSSGLDRSQLAFSFLRSPHAEREADTALAQIQTQRTEADAFSEEESHFSAWED
jgi:hypothetical protein